MQWENERVVAMAYQGAFPRGVGSGGDVELGVGDDRYGEGYGDGYGSCMSKSDGVRDHGHGRSGGLQSCGTSKVHDGDCWRRGRCRSLATPTLQRK